MKPLLDSPTPRRLAALALLLGLALMGPPAPDGRGAQAKPVAAAAGGDIPEPFVKGLTWRAVGPANMSGRVTALAVCEPDPFCYYVATGRGGLLKTTNNGLTCEHQID